MATRASAGRTVQLGDDRGNCDEWLSEPFVHVGRVFRWLIGEGWKRTDAVRIDYSRHPEVVSHNMTYGNRKRKGLQQVRCCREDVLEGIARSFVD